MLILLKGSDDLQSESWTISASPEFSQDESDHVPNFSFNQK